MSILTFDNRTNGQPLDVALAYASRSDFQRIFTEDMGSLHLLALILTADAAKAEQVFVAGLQESIHGNTVFKEWARSWSKRVIIRNAIRLLAPCPSAPEGPNLSACAADAASDKDAWIGSIMQLPAFERFVFIILVLEGHSESDCASLMGCSMQEMIRARSRALESIAATRASNPLSQSTQSAGLP